MWWSSRLVSQGEMNDSPDGLHSSNASLRLRSQILLNLYCNDHMNFNDGTCCSSTEPYTSLQSYMLIFFIIWLVNLMYKHFYIFTNFEIFCVKYFSWNFNGS